MLRLGWMFSLIGPRCSERFPKQLLPVGERCPFFGWEETRGAAGIRREGGHAFPARFGSSDSQLEAGGILCCPLQRLNLQCLRVGLSPRNNSCPEQHSDKQTENETENCSGNALAVPHHLLVPSWKPEGPGWKLCFFVLSFHRYYLLVSLCTWSPSHRSVFAVPKAAKRSLYDTSIKKQASQTGEHD